MPLISHLFTPNILTPYKQRAVAIDRIAEMCHYYTSWTFLTKATHEVVFYCLENMLNRLIVAFLLVLYPLKQVML